jgi:hypothetical protein
MGAFGVGSLDFPSLSPQSALSAGSSLLFLLGFLGFLLFNFPLSIFSICVHLRAVRSPLERLVVNRQEEIRILACQPQQEITLSPLVL